MTERPPSSGKQVIEKSLADWAAEAAGEKGIRCPRCYCPATRVTHTINSIGAKERRRVCLHCGYPMKTEERLTGLGS